MILPRNRTFGRKAPDTSAKVFLIFCEGAKRERDYFQYFAEIDSRVRVEVIAPRPDEDNSPVGLVQKAQTYLEEADFLRIRPTDEIWFVVDTDRWGEKLEELYRAVVTRSNWNIGQSNPCFELWLYFHFTYQPPNFPGMAQSANWKAFLDRVRPGGFNSRKHPLLIEDAIRNAKINFRTDATGKPEFLSTNLHLLGSQLLKILGPKIASARRRADL